MAESNADERRGRIAQAALDGDQLELLRAMRDRLAAALDSPSATLTAIAAGTKRLREVVDEIASLEAAAEDDAEQDWGEGVDVGDLPVAPFDPASV